MHVTKANQSKQTKKKKNRSIHKIENMKTDFKNVIRKGNNFFFQLLTI